MTYPGNIVREKIILCAIDFSRPSVRALRWTLDMARYLNAEVDILFCYRLIQAGGIHLPGIKKEIEAEAMEKFSKLEKQIIMQSAVPYRFVSEVGFFFSRMEEYVKERPVNLIVGSSSLRTSVLDSGEGFAAFLSKTSIPVTIIPELANEWV